jgi:Mg2+ and Co2+ transporter CorA
MSLIEKNSQIPDMYLSRHKHDTVSEDHGYDYSSNILRRTLSPVLYNNTDTADQLDKLQDMTVTMVEEILPVRNLFLFTHDKYYNKHGR